jgi:phenol hydroxylase P0 protein
MATENFDIRRKFVRETGRTHNGFVEFEFSIGDPDTAVELVMPPAAYEEFCRTHGVETLQSRAPLPAGADESGAEFDWTLRQANHERFRRGDGPTEEHDQMPQMHAANSATPR